MDLEIDKVYTGGQLEKMGYEINPQMTGMDTLYEMWIRPNDRCFIAVDKTMNNFYLVTDTGNDTFNIIRKINPNRKRHYTLHDICAHGEDGLGLDKESLRKIVEHNCPHITPANLKQLMEQLQKIAGAMFDIGRGDVGDWMIEDGQISFGVLNWVIDECKEGDTPSLPYCKYDDYSEGGPESTLGFTIIRRKQCLKKTKCAA